MMNRKKKMTAHMDPKGILPAIRVVRKGAQSDRSVPYSDMEVLISTYPSPIYMAPASTPPALPSWQTEYEDRIVVNWIYIRERTLVFLVRLELGVEEEPLGIPVSQWRDHRFCMKKYPCEVMTWQPTLSVVSRILFADGHDVAVFGRCSAFEFDFALRGTEAFWIDLYREARLCLEFREKEIPKLMAIADRHGRQDQNKKAVSDSVRDTGVRIVETERQVVVVFQGRKTKLTGDEAAIIRYCQEQYETGGETEFSFAEAIHEAGLYSQKSTKPSQIFRKDRRRARERGFIVFPLFFTPVKEAPGFYQYHPYQ